MPNLHLTKDQVRSLTTFLLGSQENPLPENYQYRPRDYRRDIQEGWWVVKKYNCMGCHQLIPGQKTSLMAMTRYQGADGQEQTASKLLTEGARVNPEWLLRFLEESGAQRQRGQSQRRALLLASAHAHLLVLRKRAGQTRALSSRLSRGKPFPYIAGRNPGTSSPARFRRTRRWACALASRSARRCDCPLCR